MYFNHELNRQASYFENYLGKNSDLCKIASTVPVPPRLSMKAVGSEINPADALPKKEYPYCEDI
jgi:hypothetical protein